jgi:hypothetical protein
MMRKSGFSKKNIIIDINTNILKIVEIFGHVALKYIRQRRTSLLETIVDVMSPWENIPHKSFELWSSSKW